MANRKNKVEVSLYISKGTEQYPAVRKISDKLTVLNCSFGGSNEGYANISVKVFSSTVVQTQLAPGTPITVTGWLGVDSYTDKNGKKRSNLILNAKEIVGVDAASSAAPAEASEAAAEENPFAAATDPSSEDAWM